MKRRRINVLFILVVTAACTMFLAATTDSVAMLWAFGLSFLATCGYRLRARSAACPRGWRVDRRLARDALTSASDCSEARLEMSVQRYTPLRNLGL